MTRAGSRRLRSYAFVLLASLAIVPCAAARERLVRGPLPTPVKERHTESVRSVQFVPIVPAGATLQIEYPTLAATATAAGGDQVILAAPIHLPDGARITHLALDFCAEGAPDGALTAGVVQMCAGGVRCAANPMAEVLRNRFAPSDCATAMHSFEASPLPPIDNATTHLYAEVLLRPFCAGGGTSCMKFGNLIISYALEPAPVPATATFEDVPPSHPLFRFIEALAAAGTVECAPRRFCPDETLTNGEAAAIIGSALGPGW